MYETSWIVNGTISEYDLISLGGFQITYPKQYIKIKNPIKCVQIFTVSLWILNQLIIWKKKHIFHIFEYLFSDIKKANFYVFLVKATFFLKFPIFGILNYLLSQNLLDDCEPTKEVQKTLQFVPANHSYII